MCHLSRQEHICDVYHFLSCSLFTMQLNSCEGKSKKNTVFVYKKQDVLPATSCLNKSNTNESSNLSCVLWESVSESCCSDPAVSQHAVKQSEDKSAETSNLHQDKNTWTATQRTPRWSRALSGRSFSASTG